jgi:hypothetical protein
MQLPSIIDGQLGVNVCEAPSASVSVDDIIMINYHKFNSNFECIR